MLSLPALEILRGQPSPFELCYRMFGLVCRAQAAEAPGPSTQPGAKVSRTPEGRSTMPDVNGGPLAAFAADVHSQCGEDGILAEILRRLGDLDHWAVEFGAWDGVMMSNTAALAERGWERVLIEGDPAKHQELVRRYAGDSSTIAIRGMVGWEGRQALDSLLAATPVPEDFDVLSIDIDGNDYHAWAAVERYNPKVVIVEFNPTVRNGVRYVQPRDSAINRGCSISIAERPCRQEGLPPRGRNRVQRNLRLRRPSPPSGPPLRPD